MQLSYYFLSSPVLSFCRCYMHGHTTPMMWGTTYYVQWSPSITDTTGTNDFVLYTKVSFAQGVIIDHASLIVFHYTELCTTTSPHHHAAMYMCRSVLRIRPVASLGSFLTGCKQLKVTAQVGA